MRHVVSTAVIRAIVASMVLTGKGNVFCLVKVGFALFWFWSIFYALCIER